MEAEARVEQVTVYASGARVRRIAEISVAVTRLRLTNLPLAVIDDTVRVEVDGPAIATNVRAGLDAPAGESSDEEPATVRAARHRVAVAEAELARIEAALARVIGAAVIASDPTELPPADAAAVLAARRALLELRGERARALRDGEAAARRTLEDARLALAAELDRDRRAGSARAPKLHELRKHVDIELVARGEPGPLVVRLDYLVAAARWAPSYVARLDGDRMALEVRAVVAQDSGEDWSGVALWLSTAEPTRFAALPELAAQRIGRRQPEPARAGFRAPPAGAGELYGDYDRELPARELAHEIAQADDFAEEVWDDGTSRPKAAFKTVTVEEPQRRAAPAPAPPPPLQAFAALAGSTLVADKADRGAPEPPPPPVPRLDYANLVMAGAASPQRGKLVAAPVDRVASAYERELAAAQARLAVLPLPGGCSAEWSHAYDHAYAADGRVDVRADGAWHGVHVTAGSATAKLSHVSVPREQADVFRIAAFANPFAGPLLPGPIDVYDRGRFLVTSAVDYTPPNASVDIGLGVDPAVKIARNAEYREETAGVLRGRLQLHHAVAIDVHNLSPRPVELEVRERVPVTREGDDDVEVIAGKIEPAWERWTPDPEAPRERALRGGYRWRVALAPGQARTLRAAYEVRIANKLELVGGNRREP